MGKFWIPLFLTLFFLGKAGYSQEKILSYHSEITIESSGDLMVTENIRVRAEGVNIKRGIYREFPTKYEDKLGNHFNVDFEVTEVLRDGQTESFHTVDERNGVVVYVGKEDVILDPGEYNYTLSFKTTRQVGFFENYDELYFNAIGGGWNFNIDTASVVVNLPAGSELMQAAAYSGYAGSTACDCALTKYDDRLLVTSTKPFSPGEQLTVAVGWPKGFVKEPTQAEKTTRFLKSNLFIFFSIIGIIIIFILYFRLWKRHGIDPPKGTIYPIFNPPGDFSPAEIGFLRSMGMTQRVMTASIVSMAIKGFLKINKEKKKYKLEKMEGNGNTLTPEESAIWNRFFRNDDILELDNKNHSTFTVALTQASHVMEKKMKPRYFSLNSYRLIPVFLLSVAWAILTFIFSPVIYVPVILSVLFIILFIVFFWLIKAPTVEGRKVMDEIEGFKMYLSVAEKDKLNFFHEPDMTVERFEEMLPYAIALGVENKWGKKFEYALERANQDTNSYHPVWYVGMYGTNFSPQQFSSSIGSSFSSAMSSASTPPGSSSGSGGGGFSGGGGGGGGGGGW